MNILKVLLFFIIAALLITFAIPKTSDQSQRTTPVNEREYLEQTWYKSTFPTTMDSVHYHVKKHGKGRNAVQYTQDAMAFYERYKNRGRRVTLKDRQHTPGIKIRVNNAGGLWTEDGKLVTFWD